VIDTYAVAYNYKRGMNLWRGLGQAYYSLSLALCGGSDLPRDAIDTSFVPYEDLPGTRSVQDANALFALVFDINNTVL
jgi:hypothetical protein